MERQNEIPSPTVLMIYITSYDNINILYPLVTVSSRLIWDSVTHPWGNRPNKGNNKNVLYVFIILRADGFSPSGPDFAGCWTPSLPKECPECIWVACKVLYMCVIHIICKHT